MDAEMLTRVAACVVYATAGFIFLPAGRDIVSYRTNILPGEKDMRKAMNMTSVKVRPFFWGVWGLNHCMMSVLKIYAVHAADLTLLKILSAQTVLCLAYLVLNGKKCAEVKADLSGFRNVFILEALAICYLAHA